MPKLLDTAHNLLLFTGAFIWQWAIGVAIDALKSSGASPQRAFQATFGAFLLIQCFGWAWFFVAPRLARIAQFSGASLEQE